MPVFQKASLRAVRLRMAMDGPSKSGKTFQSIMVARDAIKILSTFGELHGNGRIGVICSEEGRANYYAKSADYDVAILHDFSPSGYISLMNECANEKYSFMIIDQITHEWTGKGGTLDIQARAQAASSSGNGFTDGWRIATPEHDRFIESMMRYPFHLIATMRSDTEYVLEVNDKGKQVPVKKGLKPIQRKTTEFEFDIVGHIGSDHITEFEARGDLADFFRGRQFLPGKTSKDIGELKQVGEAIGKWLAETTESVTSNQPSFEEIAEIRALGDRLGMNQAKWQGLFEHLSKKKFPELGPVLSFNSLTHSHVAYVKADMIKQVSKPKLEATQV